MDETRSEVGRLKSELRVAHRQLELMKRENARLRLALRLIHGEEPPVVELDEDRVTALLEEEKPAAPDKTR